jgi:hypothetical protein
MSDDEAIWQNVLEDLRWSPRVNATHIGVSVLTIGSKGGRTRGHCQTNFSDRLWLW